ncbi:hypothetical protein Ocin01_13741 [Orchesella cincta]|uniref:Uncharacterized protein n=1 Tax=Orchesella cincta TaxID=48709 RepID=A0A1D2MJ66_ORCCI|nr:hypothetical protein Ocin01_13741 [Orchesella cincta]
MIISCHYKYIYSLTRSEACHLPQNHHISYNIFSFRNIKMRWGGSSSSVLLMIWCAALLVSAVSATFDPTGQSGGSESRLAALMSSKCPKDSSECTGLCTAIIKDTASGKCSGFGKECECIKLTGRSYDSDEESSSEEDR